jgi:hypothetical protein
MNLSQLTNLFLYWVDDVNGTYFTPPQTTLFLNNAQREVQKQLIQSGENWYVQRVFSYTVTNQDTYALPTDFLRLHKLELVLQGVGITNENRQTIIPVTLIQLDQIGMNLTAAPEVYNIRKNCFTMRPIPDNIYKIYLAYTYQVQDMVNSFDLPDVPPRYHEYVAVTAAIDGFIKDGRDMSQLLTKKQEYKELMKQDAQNRNVDQSKSVVVTDDCVLGYLF